MSEDMTAVKSVSVTKNAEGHYILSFTLPAKATEVTYELRDLSVQKDARGEAPMVWCGDNKLLRAAAEPTEQSVDISRGMSDEQVSLPPGHEIIVIVTPFFGTVKGTDGRTMFSTEPAPTTEEAAAPAVATTEVAPQPTPEPTPEPTTPAPAKNGHPDRRQRPERPLGTPVIPANFPTEAVAKGVPTPTLLRAARFGAENPKGLSLLVAIDPSVVTRVTVVGKNSGGEIVFPEKEMDVAKLMASKVMNNRGVVFGPVREFLESKEPRAELDPNGEVVTFTAVAYDDQGNASKAKSLVCAYSAEQVRDILSPLRQQEERTRSVQERREIGVQNLENSRAIEDLQRKIAEMEVTLLHAATKTEVINIRRELDKMEKALKQEIAASNRTITDGVRIALDEKFAAMAAATPAPVTTQTTKTTTPTSMKTATTTAPTTDTPTPDGGKEKDKDKDSKKEKKNKSPKVKVEVVTNGHQIQWTVVIVMVVLLAFVLIYVLGWLRQTPPVIHIPVNPNVYGGHVEWQPIQQPATPARPSAPVKFVRGSPSTSPAALVTNELKVKEIDTVGGELPARPQMASMQPIQAPAPVLQREAVVQQVVYAQASVPVASYGVEYHASLGQRTYVQSTQAYCPPAPINVVPVNNQRGNGYVLQSSPAFGVSKDLVRNGTDYRVVTASNHGNRGNRR